MATRLNELPPPCAECAPEGRFRIIEVKGETVYARCRCARGRMLSALTNRPIPPLRAEPVLTADEISLAVEGLASIPWFPKEEGARTMIADAVARLCTSGPACFELVRRMVDSYKEWPCVREMRICYCAMIGSPLSGDDLHLAVSEFYPDGFGRPLTIAGPTSKALPPTKEPEVLDDPTWRASLEKDLATIPPQRQYSIDPEAMAAERREVLKQRHREAMATVKPITQADIDKAVEELHAKKERGEVA